MELIYRAMDEKENEVVEETEEVLEATEQPETEVIEDAVKIGARNASADAQRIQQIHNLSHELGAACEVEEAVADPQSVTNAVKLISLTDTTATVAGYGVVFGGQDLARDTFTAETDFKLDLVPVKLICYDHTLGDEIKEEIGVAPNAAIKIDGYGMWIEAQLDRSKAYVSYILELIEQGVLGWSSGSISHLVRRENGVIKSWPIVEFSLTPTPAEPRTLGVMRVKSTDDVALDDTSEIEEISAAEAVITNEDAPVSDEPGIKEVEVEETDTAIITDVVDLGANITNIEVEENNNMSDENYNELKTQLDSITAILSRFDNEPVLRNAGFVSPDGGKADKNVKSFADFLTAVRRKDHTRLTEVYETKAALAEDSGTTGGYLVPTEYSAQIRQVQAETSVVRPRAFLYPMQSRNVQIPVLNQATAPTAGNTSYYGGIVMNWTEEAGAVTETEPTFKMLELVAHKLSGYTLGSHEVNADSAVGLEAMLRRLFADAITWHEDYAFLRGNGVGKPLGIQNAACAISVTRAGSGNDFDPADLGTMLRRLLPQSLGRAVWVMHPYLQSSLIGLVSSTANVSWLGNYKDGAPMSLMGIPVVFSEKMNTAGSAFDVLLADFSYYIVGDRQGIEVASSEHYRFINDQQTWRVTERVDGQPWMSAPVTLSDASSTLSPFVYLT